ncbi:MAG TPA: hypothetical protein VK465_09060, partial [Fibrobacteria bacterium]|nr:hypothetical protein [Fibrobacteria bacterium]
NARIADGVVGISQPNPKAGWGTTLAAVKEQLKTLPGCQVTGVRGDVPALRILPGELKMFWNGRDGLGRKMERESILPDHAR